MKNVISAAFLGFLALTGSLFGQEPDSAAYNFAMALLAAEEGEHARAVDGFARAVALDPKDPYLRLEYAQYLLRAGRLDDALAQVREARVLAPEDPFVLRLLGRVEMARVGRSPDALDGAREAFEKVRAMAPEDLESMVALGQIYLGEERLDEAIVVFQELLSFGRGGRRVVSLLTEAFLRAERKPEARALLEKTLATDPGFQRARLMLADLLSEGGEHSLAAAILSTEPGERGGDYELTRRLALELYRLGDMTGALEAIERALATRGGDRAAGYLKALILLASGRNEAAESHLIGLLAEDSDDRDLQSLLVRAMEHQGKYREVQTVLADAAAAHRLAGENELAVAMRIQQTLASTRAESWADAIAQIDDLLDEVDAARAAELVMLRADALLHLDRGEEAIELLDRSPYRSSHENRFRAKEAEIYFRMGKEHAAERSIRRFTKNNSTEGLRYAAQVYQRVERYDQAAMLLSKVLNRDGEGVDTLFSLGAAYERIGRWEEAASLFEQLLEQRPDFAPALNYLGYMWADREEKLDEALRLVQRAAALDPGNGAYVDSLGWAHYRLGEYTRAESFLIRAARLVPDDSVIQEHLGDLYRALGRMDDASYAYRKALELGGENAAQVRDKLRSLAAN